MGVPAIQRDTGAVALPTAQDLNHLLQIGEMLVRSGLMPQTVRTAEAAATIVLKGHELGLPPMAAMEGIAVVQGKAVIGAHLMLALVKRAYGPGAIWVSETTNERATISYRIPGVPEVLTYSFTWQDAERAGLTGKDTWRKFPAAMLRARAISAAVKLGFPEVVGGMYVPGEIDGTDETVTPDGDVVIDITAQSRPVAPPVIEVVDTETGEIVETAPVGPTRAELAARVMELAMELELASEELSALATEVTGKTNRGQWNREDFGRLIDRLSEDLAARGTGHVQPELIEADGEVGGEAGDDEFTR